MNLPPPLLSGDFVEIDRHFADFIAGFGSGELPAIAAAVLSRAIRSGHICLDLADAAAFENEPGGFRWPKLDTWRRALKKNRATGGPDDGRPLVLDDAGRLYLRRYWEYEKSLAAAILERCKSAVPVRAKATDDMQQLAVETALARRFVVISGGPGTGKTTTVLKIIERILAETKGAIPRIALAAPTGKAAARLEDSLRGAGSALPDGAPKSASTLHRLLGWRPDSAAFRHNARNPLPVDMVVVDEASMVPLTMMAKLFDALPAHARVILLGDRHQLASVDPGYVMGDIAGAAENEASPLSGSLVTLQKNYRFGEKSGIFELSLAVRDGSADRALELLAANLPGVTSDKTPPPPQLAEKLRASIVAGFSTYLRQSDPLLALEEFQKFRVLCALRSGPYGVENLNRAIAEVLWEEGLVAAGRLYAGLPMLITQNDYELRLFNGDIGILVPDPDAGGALTACFRDEQGALRRIPPARLPVWETAFAMTIHKSQGSEYDNVLLILPDRESPVLTRELIYTGLTRARIRVEILSQEPVLREAIGRVARRSSGLRERLG